jgi:hypothetical protein
MKQFDNLTLQQGSHARMQFGILPLQQFGILLLQVAVWYPATVSGQQPPRACSLLSCHCKWQFGILPLQQGNSRHVHAVWYPASASDCRALVCSLRNCPCRGAKLLAGLQRGGSLVVWTMQSCNGRQAVMSALEALVLAGKGLNAFSVLFIFKTRN